MAAGVSGREIVPAQAPLQWHGRRELAPDIEVTQRVGRLGILTPGLTPLLNTAMIVSPWHTHTQSSAKQKVARHVERIPPFTESDRQFALWTSAVKKKRSRTCYKIENFKFCGYFSQTIVLNSHSMSSETSTVFKKCNARMGKEGINISLCFFVCFFTTKKTHLLLFCSHSDQAAGPQLARRAINKYRNRYINKWERSAFSWAFLLFLPYKSWWEVDKHAGTQKSRSGTKHYFTTLNIAVLDNLKSKQWKKPKRALR